MSLHVVTSTAHGDEAIQKLLFLNKRSKSRTAATLVAGGPAGVCMCVCILCMCLYMSCIGYCVVISLSQLYHWFAFILHSSESCGVLLCSMFSFSLCLHACVYVCAHICVHVCMCVCMCHILHAAYKSLHAGYIHFWNVYDSSGPMGCFPAVS